MSILLQWTPRCNADEQRVYRDTSPLDPLSLPTPLATLSGIAASYTDDTTVAEIAYWYAVGAVATGPSPDVIALSRQVQLTDAGGIAPPAAITMRSTVVAVGATDETIDVTIADFGTPKAAIFTFSPMVTLGTERDSAQFSYGFFDGTDQACTVAKAAHGAGAAANAAGRGVFDTYAAVVVDGSTGSNTLGVTITADALITDGVTITVDGLGTDYLLTVTLLGGEIEAKAGTFTAVNSSSVTVTTGIAPDVIVATASYGTVNADPIDSGSAFANLGFAAWNGSSYDQAAVNSRFDVAATHDSRGEVRDGALIAHPTSRWIAASTYTATSFDADTTGTAGGVVAYLALQLDEGSAEVVIEDMPTSTGVKSFASASGNDLAGAFLAKTTMPAVNTFYTSGLGGSIALGIVTPSETYSQRYTVEDGVATTDTEYLLTDELGELANDDGSDAYRGAAQNFSGNGFEIDFTTVRGAADKWPVLYLNDRA